MKTGLILAAPGSGSGKTTITLGILRALSRRGLSVRGAKSGPDYIDPRFHEAACAAPCPNLDPWAMKPARIRAIAAQQMEKLLLIEGAMGLFDGAPPDGKGATADLARILGIPVVLIVDCAHVAQSIAPLVHGFAAHDPHVKICGVILNKIGSARHEAMLRRALAPLGLPVLGAVHRLPHLVHPSRHLGLVQAREHPDINAYMNQAADMAETAIDLEALRACAAPLPPARADTARLPAPAQRIAIAQDEAFAFAYWHILEDWRAAGAQISFFSPLANEVPPPADLIFLPGGYPELHAGRLAAATDFLDGLRRAAETTMIHGECGGYMVLGETLTDAQGTPYPMAGLLALETTFATRRLHLGYRRLSPLGGPFSTPLLGHEFHYASTLKAKGDPLFMAQDAEGNPLPPMGLIRGRISGSFAHMIDAAP